MSEGHTERLKAALDGRYRIEQKLGEGGMASAIGERSGRPAYPQSSKSARDSVIAW